MVVKQIEQQESKFNDCETGLKTVKKFINSKTSFVPKIAQVLT